MIFKNAERQQKHVVEINDVLEFEQFLVTLVNLRKRDIGRTVEPGVLKRLLGVEHPVLRMGDEYGRLVGGRVVLRVAELGGGLTQNALLVAVVGDAEVGIEVPGKMNVAPEHAGTERMEGS